jgi:hypothetical protein
MGVGADCFLATPSYKPSLCQRAQQLNCMEPKSSNPTEHDDEGTTEKLGEIHKGVEASCAGRQKLKCRRAR